MSRHHTPESTSPVSFWANVARLPNKGMPVTIVATDRQRDELAATHGLEAVERYEAELLVAKWKRNGVRVVGQVTADIVQSCVVTLEPIPAHISEQIDSLFLPQDSKLGRLGFEGGGEILLDAEGDDAPETFSGDAIDVGALAEQIFGLAIDPYPRKAGAALDQAVQGGPAETPAGPLQQKLAALLRKD